MTSFALRCLALLTMICDHAGYALYSSMPWLRIVGRLSFPIYCFLLAQGFRHTRNVKGYALRLGLFALISEVPFNLLFYRRVWMPAAHNVFFSLLLALGALAACKRFAREKPFWAGLCVVAACALALLLHTDYTFLGILLALAFYAAEERPLRLALGFAGVLGLYTLYRLDANVPARWVVTQLYSLLSLPLILLYNGKPGFRGGKWLFYLLYPAHLLALVYWKNILALFRPAAAAHTIWQIISSF